MKPMKIDFQAHYIPQGYIEKLEKRTEPPYFERRGDNYLFQYGPNSAYAVTKEAYDIETIVAAMDRAGIDMQVLSINIPGAEILDTKSSIDLARMINDSYAEVIAAYPGRFQALTTLPLRDTDASLEELERATHKLGFNGMMFFSNVLGAPISDPRFWPIYEMAQDLDQPIFLHPTRPVMADEVKEYGLEMIVGYIFDTTLAALKLIFSGVLEKYPNLKLILPHAGSTLPYLLGRIDYQSGHLEVSRKNLQKPPSEYIKKLYMDTVCLSAPALKMAYDLVGADHILFATDHPFLGMDLSVNLVEQMDIPAECKQKIFCGNAKKLLKIIDKF